MTEGEWLACTDPIVMVEFLRGNPTSEDAVTWWPSRWRVEEAGKGNDRKFRLFSCACCRRIWDHIPETCNRDAVAAVEDYLDGHLPAPGLQAALVASSAVEWKEDGSGRRSEPGYWVVKYLGRGFYKMTAAASALLVASRVMLMADEEYGREAGHEFDVCFYSAAGDFLRPFRWPLPMPPTVEAERVTQAALLRCIFGNPFRPVVINSAVPAWNDGAVVKTAKAVYERRSFEDMPLLGDALEDAGCMDADILGHCREPGGVHVRGCWVIDLLLGKD